GVSDGAEPRGKLGCELRSAGAGRRRQLRARKRGRGFRPAGVVTMTDQELADILAIARKANVAIFVRGTDARPVVETRCKLTGKVVGGVELRKRVNGE